MESLKLPQHLPSVFTLPLVLMLGTSSFDSSALALAATRRVRPGLSATGSAGEVPRRLGLSTAIKPSTGREEHIVRFFCEGFLMPVLFLFVVHGVALCLEGKYAVVRPPTVPKCIRPAGTRASAGSAMWLKRLYDTSEP